MGRARRTVVNVIGGDSNLEEVKNRDVSLEGESR
jgi:hypothetical protein